MEPANRPIRSLGWRLVVVVVAVVAAAAAAVAVAVCFASESPGQCKNCLRRTFGEAEEEYSRQTALNIIQTSQQTYSLEGEAGEEAEHPDPYWRQRLKLQRRKQEE